MKHADVKLARGALENDDRRGWNLLQQPERLNIQTIDAVCLAIAHETPLLSRLGGSLSPTDKPQPLYTLAARRTLARLGSEEPLSSALAALLQLRGTSLPDCQKLIAEMLDKRDQWGRVLPLGQATLDWPLVRAFLEAPLRRTHEQAIQKAQITVRRHTRPRTGTGGSPEPRVRQRRSGFPVDRAEACHRYSPPDRSRAVELPMSFSADQRRHLAQERHSRDRISIRQRRQSGQGALCISHRASRRAIRNSSPCSAELRALPPQEYTEEESQMLQHMLVILRYAIAELRLVFAERGVVDFVELGLAARQVLRDDEGELSELAADVAARWPHLLVDEFQDTSRSQYELLTLIASGWESAGRGTCFLVGDPMQSIYMFRQAEVELFERTRRYGLGRRNGGRYN